MAVVGNCSALPVSDPKTGSWAREMTDTYGGDDDGEDDPDWGQQNTIAKRAVALSCGCFGVGPDAGKAHRHDGAEAEAARKLAGELGQLLDGVYVFLGDESDHLLKPFYAPPLLPGPGDAAGDSAASAGTAALEPGEITEDLIRGPVFGGALDPRYPLMFKKLPTPEGYPAAGGTALSKEAVRNGFVRFRRETLKMDEADYANEPYWSGDGDGAKMMAKWEAAYAWLMTHPDIIPNTPVLIGMHEPRAPPPPQPAPGPDAPDEEKRAYYKALSAGRVSGCIFPRIFAARTKGGSVVGVAAVVVHT